MVSRPLSAFRVLFSLALVRGGLLPILALLCLLGAAGLHFVLVPQSLQRTNLSQRQLADQQNRPVEISSSQSLALQYAEIRARLARHNDRGELLKALFKKAAEAGVTLTQADYRLQPDLDFNCEQLQITLPVQGTYLQIRAFVDDALSNIASLALDEISFRRENVKNPNIEVRLRFTLFLRTED